jgi:multicomponent Na+:H+ antiporter subunit B
VPRRNDMRIIILVFTLVALGAVLTISFLEAPQPTEPLKPVAQIYALETVEKTGATNVISAINFDWRAYDTLGESTILLTAATGVKLLMRRYVQRRRETGTA